jgi:hypothetical protein
MSSKVRGRSSSMRVRLSSKGAQQRDRGSPSSRDAPRLAVDFEGGAPLASRRGVKTGGPAGASNGGAGAAEGGAGAAGAFEEGAGAVAGAAGAFEERAGAAAGGAGAVAGAADGAADGGAAAGGGGIGAGGVGVAVASLDCRKMCSLRKELTDDIAVSTLRRTAATPSKYPKACWLEGTKPRKV